jgi:trehalose 6-phosphate synthase
VSTVQPHATLLVASNRGPLAVVAVDDGDDQIRRGSGGLVSGMQTALAASPDAVWVCAAMNDRERSLARQAPSGRISELDSVAEALGGDFDVRLLPIDALTFRNAYNGIANSTLWFVLHMLYGRAQAPVFDAVWRRQWAAYVGYNQAFAHALAEEAAPGAKVMIQDYHLLLAPRMLRTMRPDVRIAHFTHTPWVSPETFAMLPNDVSYAICDGMLGADLLGFHTERWAQLFRETCQAVLGRTPDGVSAFPLGVDADELAERAKRRDVENAVARLADDVGDRLVIGRIDRAELSKNVWRGLLAFRELLRTRPEWRNRVVHAVFDNPSREDLPAYREYAASLERMAAEINDEFSTEEWTPVLLTIAEDYPAALATLRSSDVLFINPLRDGMNLVALEGLVVSDRDPALVLSHEAGAADVLGEDAFLVNPFDVTAMAEALHAALTSSPTERRERAQRMREAATRLPPDRWFQAQLDALDDR